MYINKWRNHEKSKIANKRKVSYIKTESQSGCSAARLARLPWAQEVPGSNPGIPTNIFLAHFKARNQHKGYPGLRFKYSSLHLRLH